MRSHWVTGAGIVATLVLLGTACSIKRMAVNKIGDSLAESGTTFASDDDVELIGAAVPFSLKLMESLLEASPRHRGLLFATASGFTQYAYAYVQQDADRLEPEDLTRATAARDRARRLYLRARGYGIRGLETRHQAFGDSLRANPRVAVQVTTLRDVPLLYWTAAAWGAAISISKDDPDLVADQPQVEALVDRALELDEAFDDGAIHSFLISYEPSRQGAPGDPAARSRAHFDRVVELTGGQMAGPYVSLAEAVSIPAQDRQEFEALLRRALEIDPDARTEWRLANLIMQRRARWLLSRVDELFLEAPPEPRDLSFLIPAGSALGR
jgi:predicted anti-sigma-YlaC factor YlaD